MHYAGSRPMGRLFYWALTLMMVTAVGVRVEAAPAPQGGPAMTTVADTVYRADECLNASTWAKGSTQPAAVSPQA